MDQAITRRVEVDPVKRTVALPHWGITLRTLFGAVLESWPDAKPGEAREYRVLYKDKAVATLNVQQHHDSI